MTKMEDIKCAITALSDEEKIELKRWLDEVEAELFDATIEANAASGRVDGLIAKARANYKAGRRAPL